MGDRGGRTEDVRSGADGLKHRDGLLDDEVIRCVVKRPTDEASPASKRGAPLHGEPGFHAGRPPMLRRASGSAKGCSFIGTIQTHNPIEDQCGKIRAGGLYRDPALPPGSEIFVFSEIRLVQIIRKGIRKLDLELL